MKKLLTSIGVAITLATSSSYALDYHAETLLNGSAVVLTNNFTVFYTDHILYSNVQGQAVFALTNVYLAFTNTGHGFTNQEFSDGMASTNTTLATNSVGKFYPSPWAAVPLRPYINGEPNANYALAATFTGDNANSSNSITLTVCQLAPDGNICTNGTTPIFTWLVGPPAIPFGGPVTWTSTTNVPSTFVVGQNRIQVFKAVVSSVGSSVDVRLTGLWLTGWW